MTFRDQLAALLRAARPYRDRDAMIIRRVVELRYRMPR